MNRITATQVAVLRIHLAAEQGNRCALCRGPFKTTGSAVPVLDHDHKTGAVRGVLHRGCNALLGKVENNAPRYGVYDIAAFTNGIADYLRKHLTNITGYLHHTYRTEEEKRVRRNTKARITRAKKKDNT